MTTPAARSVGIDVSKASLDAHARPVGTTRRFDNSPGGIAARLGWVGPLAPTLAVLAATGGYGNAAAAALSLAGLPVVLVDPKRVRDFAKAVGRLAKTDALDAAILAAFADKVRPPIRPLADAETQDLRALLTRRGQPIGMRTMGTNRLGGVTDKAVRRSIEAVLEVLGTAVEAADEAAEALIQSSAVWRAKDELLQSIPGIGPVVRRALLSEWPQLGMYSREEVASLVGVAPVNQDSGTWEGKRMIAGGRAFVRSLLYLASHAARQGNAVRRAFGARREKAGKAPKVIRLAIARKLLIMANAVLRDERPWKSKIA